MWFPGGVNAVGKTHQKWYATTATKFTKPGDHLLAKFCLISTLTSWLGEEVFSTGCIIVYRDQLESVLQVRLVLLLLLIITSAPSCL